MRKNISLILLFLSFTCSFSAYSQEFLEETYGNVIADDYVGAEAYDPCCVYECDHGSFTIGGDWLYWKVEEDGLQVGALVNFTPVSETAFAINSRILKPKFKYDSGYRVSADYVTANKNWDLGLTFTHVPSKAGLATFLSPATISFNFVSLFAMNFPVLNAISSGMFSTVIADWDVDTNYLDLDLARRITICDTIQIQPHLGIRALWIDQKFEISGVGTTPIPVPPFSAPLAFTSRMKNNMDGIGIEGGLWGSWYLNYGLSIVGHFGGSLIYVEQHNRGELDAITGAEVGETLISFNDRSHLSIPSLDSFIGFVYAETYCNTLLNIHVGWEHHTIFDANQFSILGGRKMTMQGLTLGGSVTF